MDPLTQGVVGVTAAQLTAAKPQKAMAAVLGFLSGMAADLDVLIRSAEDPLLFLEFHRHFTHALVFIPIGALICASVFYFVIERWFAHRRLSFKQVYLFSFAGYASHAVLDACTTYGTQLFWPFSSTRVAWNNVSVIDPLFTIPLALMIGWAVVKKSTPLAAMATVYALSYLSLGIWQGERAREAAVELAQSRGHTPIRLGLKPSFANIIVWKSVYEYAGNYYVDAIRVFANAKVYEGGATAKLDIDQHFPWLDKQSQQAKDIQRFSWFSNQHLGLDPANPNRIIDIRYSMVPNRFDGMWGISLSADAQAHQHVVWTSVRPQGEELGVSTDELWSMVVGEDVAPRLDTRSHTSLEQ